MTNRLRSVVDLAGDEIMPVESLRPAPLRRSDEPKLGARIIDGNFGTGGWSGGLDGVTYGSFGALSAGRHAGDGNAGFTIDHTCALTPGTAFVIVEHEHDDPTLAARRCWGIGIVSTTAGGRLIECVGCSWFRAEFHVEHRPSGDE